MHVSFVEHGLQPNAAMFMINLLSASTTEAHTFHRQPDPANKYGVGIKNATSLRRSQDAAAFLIAVYWNK